MLEELLNIQETWEFEAYGLLSLFSACRRGEDLELVLQLYPGVEEDEQPQLWKLICYEERENHLILGGDCYLELLNEHALLWAYTQPVTSLTFRSIAGTVDAWDVTGRLYSKHRELVAEWISFEQYFNGNISLAALLTSGHGLLAEGPEQLIKGYQQVMNESGFQTSTLSRPSKRWHKSRGWIEESNDYVLVKLNRSYVVTSRVSVDKTTSTNS
ncbi:MAG: hypothetical protein KME12_26615 [Trichocoleus desertorum ATA4-8-CV12]|jgi:hypothetical protein|nr:hypothetical protein [Trichocoleus desertorum ATA4-8-CV12]